MTRRGRLALLFALLALGACVKAGSYRRARRAGGTCEAACRHYMACKRLENDDIFRACVVECREIFVDEGVPDRRTLRAYQQLECDEAVAFVEGDSGRVPGE